MKIDFLNYYLIECVTNQIHKKHARLEERGNMSKTQLRRTFSLKLIHLQS